MPVRQRTPPPSVADGLSDRSRRDWAMVTFVDTSTCVAPFGHDLRCPRSLERLFLQRSRQMHLSYPVQTSLVIEEGGRLSSLHSLDGGHRSLTSSTSPLRG